MNTRSFFYSFLFLGLMWVMGGCNSDNRFLEVDCKSSKDCADGWLCGSNKVCKKDTRTPEEIEAARKAEIEKLKAKKEAERLARLKAKTSTKAGEGKMVLKICPFFKNTDVSVGSIIATHQKTKKRHILNLQMETEKDSTQATFTFYSLPLGKYDVVAKYGVQSNGVFDTHKLKCDPKSTARSCKEELTREIEVVLPKEASKEDTGCDWIAE